METRSGAGAALTARLLTPGVNLMRPKATTPSVVLRSCETCGSDFNAPLYNVRRGRGRFCSLSCSSKALAGATPLPEADRFWSKVDKNGPAPDYRPELGPCWLWTGAKTRNGYGRFGVGSRRGTGEATVLAHVWAYTDSLGPFPAGSELDHLCRVHGCVRPTHLDPVTRKENIRRGLQGSLKTQCAQGHAYEGENIGVRASGVRYCRICSRASSRATYARRLANG